MLTLGAYRCCCSLLADPARPAAPRADLVAGARRSTEPVSVIVPAYNEKEGIEAAVRSLAGRRPPARSRWSSSTTARPTAPPTLVEALGLPNVRVVRVPNGGKATALNTGVALARHDLIVMVDGDTVVEPDSIRRLVQPFADPAVGAVAGNVKVGNRRSLVAPLAAHRVRDRLQPRPPPVRDAAAACRPCPARSARSAAQALPAAGGISDDTLAEDTDLTMALRRAGWRVVYEERARAWTEAPATLEQLWRQRYRWSYGTMQAMWKHRQALIDRGAVGPVRPPRAAVPRAVRRGAAAARAGARHLLPSTAWSSSTAARR